MLICLLSVKINTSNIVREVAITMKKPTMQMIADSAGVSRITVWKVLNGRPGVSPSLHDLILKTAEELGYPISRTLRTTSTNVTTNTVGTEENFTISVVVSRPDSSSFWMNIIHEIAKESVKKNYSLLYTYVPAEISGNYTLPEHLTSQTVSGMIVLNVYDSKLLSMLNQLSIPKVFLDCNTIFPLDSLKGDLVLLEGKYAVASITESLIKKGHKNIGFIGDIHYALTNHLRYEGYQAAMHKHNLKIPENVCFTSSIDPHSYFYRIHSFLETLPELPDAFICASDFIANCVFQFLTVNGYRVPEDIALSGFDNIMEYSEINELLTTVNIDTELLGKRLFYQLEYRMQKPNSNYELIYIKPEVIYRKSTN